MPTCFLSVSPSLPLSLVSLLDPRTSFASCTTVDWWISSFDINHFDLPWVILEKKPFWGNLPFQCIVEHFLVYSLACLCAVLEWNKGRACMWLWIGRMWCMQLWALVITASYPLLSASRFKKDQRQKSCPVIIRSCIVVGGRFYPWLAVSSFLIAVLTLALDQRSTILFPNRKTEPGTSSRLRRQQFSSRICLGQEIKAKRSSRYNNHKLLLWRWSFTEEEQSLRFFAWGKRLM